MSATAAWQAVNEFCVGLGPRAKWQATLDGNPDTGLLECMDWQGYGCTAVEIVQLEATSCDVEVWRCAGDVLVTARLQQALASSLGAPKTERRLADEAAPPSPKRGVEPESCLQLPDEELALVAWRHVAAGGTLSQSALDLLEALCLAEAWHVRMPARWALGRA